MTILPATPAPDPAKPSTAEKLAASLGTYAGIFAVLGIISIMGTAFLALSALDQLGAAAWIYALAALLAVQQCFWLYTVSSALAELLRR